MPKFAIMVSQDPVLLWWVYTLVIEHVPYTDKGKYDTADAAWKAAKAEANRRGHINV